MPRQLRELICKMTHQNQTWGEERIAAELLLKLGIRVSPRTVRRYMPPDVGPGKRVPSQRWMTFVRNHAQAIVACDFFIVVTASFRVLYVFDRHLRSLLKEWVTHYNRGRPHASLGPGIPDLRAGQQRVKLCGHRVPIDQQVVAKAILGGLHHEYRLERIAA